MNNQVFYPFSLQINLLILQNPYEFFLFFLRFWKYHFGQKNSGYNRATVSSKTRKILVCDIKSFRDGLDFEGLPGPWRKRTPNYNYFLHNLSGARWVFSRLFDGPVHKKHILLWQIFFIYPKFVTLRSFFKILKNVEENWKNSYWFWKINKFILNEKRIGHLIIYGQFFLPICL